MDLEEGDRVAGFVLIRDADGQLHALRAGAVQGISPAEDGAECVMTLSGGRFLRVPRPLERVLGWFA